MSIAKLISEKFDKKYSIFLSIDCIMSRISRCGLINNLGKNDTHYTATKEYINFKDICSKYIKWNDFMNTTDESKIMKYLDKIPVVYLISNLKVVYNLIPGNTKFMKDYMNSTIRNRADDENDILSVLDIDTIELILKWVQKNPKKDINKTIVKLLK